MIAMLTLRWIGFIVSLLLQTATVPSFPEGVLSPSESLSVKGEKNIERRVRIYENASARYQGLIEGAISTEEFQAIPGNLMLWIALLDESLKDIEANLKSKKKSRALIRYEIQVRKTITTLQDNRFRAPEDQQEVFDSCLARAGEVRKRFVEILFKN